MTMTRSEYETKAAAFRSLLLAEAAKPGPEQVWPDLDTWLSVQANAVCATPTCVNYGRSFEVTLRENADGVHRVMCGKCNSAITPVLILRED